MTTKRRLVTAGELLDMPDDGWRYELVRGELRRMPPAGFEHGRLASEAGSSLRNYVREHNLGVVCASETGFMIGTEPDHVRAPDAAFVRRERIEAMGAVTGYWPGAPDLVIEVISPNDRYTEVEEKVEDWLEAGTAIVIIINPRNRTATIRRPSQAPAILSGQDIIDGGEVVPGWQMALREIFA